MFARLGRWCYRHRLTVIGLWVLTAVVGGAVLGVVGSKTRTEFSLPDVESRQGIEILDDHFGGQGAGWAGSIVFQSARGVDHPEIASAMSALFDEVDTFDDVSVVSPYTPEGADQVASSGPLAGQIAYAVVELANGTSVEEAEQIAHQIREAMPVVSGLQIEMGGEVFAEFEEPTAELVGLAFAIVILIVAFGSVLAMGLPVGVALAGIGVGLVLAGFVSHLVEVPDFAQMIGIMLGLGVGIDYALFIVTRFRENRRRGHDIEASVVIAVDTAGRAVAFAGATVVISLMGMVLMQLGFITPSAHRRSSQSRCSPRSPFCPRWSRSSATTSRSRGGEVCSPLVWCRWHYWRSRSAQRESSSLRCRWRRSSCLQGWPSPHSSASSRHGANLRSRPPWPTGGAG